MKAISLWQPYASLIALGIKDHETRSWPPPEHLIGHRIAIHAAKKDVGYDHFDFATRRLLDKILPQDFWFNMPRGAVVATALLTQVYEVDRAGKVPPDQEPFGDFSLGRYVWVLSAMERVTPPLQAQGRQRIFEVAIQ